VGTTYFWTGRFVQARPHWEEVFAQYKPEDHALAFLYGGSNVKLHCLALGAQTQCWLGYPDQGLKLSQEGLAFAQTLSHPYTLAAAYFFAAWFRASRREKKEAQPLSEKAVHLATEHGFPFWSGVGGILRVWALAESGQVEQRIPEMQQALATYQATGASIFRGQALGLLAEMCSDAGQIEQGLAVVDEALAMTVETDERYWEAELHRIKGELLSKQSGSEGEAEACYFQAISVAKQQQARLFELRAVVSLCYLWCQQNRQIEARQRLAEVYNWFSEGFATPDLKAARELLAKLEGNC
jgi:predicted ATPase